MLLFYSEEIIKTVYPCVYREHPTIKIRLPENFGLSLCIQGTCKCANDSANTVRFIPVYTGNITGKVINFEESTVYPCVYREHTNYNILFYN